MKKITQKLVLLCMLALAISSYAQKKIAFIGQAGAYNDDLSSTNVEYLPEGDTAAAIWFKEDFGVNTPGVTVNYFSFEDVAAGADISIYDAIWIQYDPGTWTSRLKDFPRSAPEGDGTKHSILKETGFDWGRNEEIDGPLENAFIAKIKAYYEAGGNMLLGNFAGAGVEPFGVINPALSSPWEYKPNQDFGDVFASANNTEAPWGNWWNGASDSPLISGMTPSIDACNETIPYFEFLSAGTEKKNRVYTYNLDFGRIANDNPGASLATKRAALEDLLQAKILMLNCGQNEVPALEFKPTGFNAGKGTVISYGQGTFDWSVGTNGNNNNVKNLTKNTLLYLANKEKPLTTTIGSVTRSQCGGSYTWPVNNVTYTASTTKVITVGSNTATLNLTINIPTTNGNVTQVQTGGAYTWSANGTTYVASGIYTNEDGCNTATLNLTINPDGKKLIAFIGQAGTYNDNLSSREFKPEGDTAAAIWFKEDFGVNTPNVTVNYLSFEDVAAGANISVYDAIWIQYDSETFTDRLKDFPRSAPDGDGSKHSMLKERGFDWGRDFAVDGALEDAFIAKIKAYYQAGGNMLLGNFASAGIEPFGVINPALSSPWEYKPNQNFGDVSVNESFTNDAWGNWWNGASDSPLISGMTTSIDACNETLQHIEFLSAGTEKKNRVYQYNLDFGRIANDNPGASLATKRDILENLLQAKILLQNCGGNEIQGLEFKPTGFNAGNGTVITYGAGSYDWYVGTGGNNNNVKNLTKNTLLYLASKEKPLTTTIGSVTQSQCGGSYTWPVNNVTYTASTTEVITVGSNTATLNLTIVPAPKAGTNGTLSISASPSDAALFAALTGADAGGSWTRPSSGYVGVYTYTVAAISPCTVAAIATVTVTASTQIPATFPSFCKGATIATAATGTTGLKFYKALTGGAPLTATTALATGTYYVTEMKGTADSNPRVSRSIVVNTLPTSPSALVLTNPTAASATTAVTAIGCYVGADKALKLTATAAGASSYNWTLPAGVVKTDVTGVSTITGTIATSTDAYIYVKFTVAFATGSKISVQTVNASGCTSVIKVGSALTKVLPSTISKLVLTDGTATTSILAVGPYIGVDKDFTLTATAVTTQGLTPTSYRWVLPAGVSSGLNTGTFTTTSNVITVNFKGVTTPSGIAALPISAYAVNGVGTSAVKTLSLTRALPTVVSAVAGSLNVCNRDTGFSYTITPNATATKYLITAPAGSKVTSISSPSNTSNVLTTSDLTFKVVYGASGTSLTVKSINGVGNGATKKLTLKFVACSAIPANTTKVAPVASVFKVVAYPNPSNEGFKINSSNKKPFGVQVYDMLGRSIEQRQLKSDSQIGANYARGIYNVIVTQDAQVKTLRLIKQ